MTRNTHPRTVDVEALFPQLGPLARPAIRLHPRRGTPTTAQSSIGGPLLWPTDEPWPTCASTSHAGEPSLVPVLQLYARDIPALPHPEGADLLQILWCPLDENDALGKPLLLWRDAAAVGTRPDPAPPSLPETVGSYVLRPCVLDPEAVTDYPYEDAPEDLLERLLEHDEPYIEEEKEGFSMWDLLVVPGCKVGGYPPWIQPPHWPDCPKCGGTMNHLLSLSGDEGGRMWIPLEEWDSAGYDGGIQEAVNHDETAEANRHPLGVTFADNGVSYIFACTHCPDMPLESWYDSY